MVCERNVAAGVGTWSHAIDTMPQTEETCGAQDVSVGVLSLDAKHEDSC